MSWGNRDCTKLMSPKNEYGGCSYATMETCNYSCPYFTKEISLTKTQLRLLKKQNKC